MSGEAARAPGTAPGNVAGKSEEAENEDIACAPSVAAASSEVAAESGRRGGADDAGAGKVGDIVGPAYQVFRKPFDPFRSACGAGSARLRYSAVKF